jgi:hypothetical protein
MAGAFAAPASADAAKPVCVIHIAAPKTKTAGIVRD